MLPRNMNTSTALTYMHHDWHAWLLRNRPVSHILEQHLAVHELVDAHHAYCDLHQHSACDITIVSRLHTGGRCLLCNSSSCCAILLCKRSSCCSHNMFIRLQPGNIPPLWHLSLAPYYTSQHADSVVLHMHTPNAQHIQAHSRTCGLL